jgi:hypothetical protein
MEELIDDFVKYKPNRSISTNKQYAQRINKLIKSGVNIDDFDSIMDYLSSYKATTRSNNLTALIEYHLMKSGNLDLIDKLQKEHSITLDIYKNNQAKGIFLDNQKENYINSNQLMGYMDLINNIIIKHGYENKLDFPAIDYLNLRLILHLLVNHPSRNEYSTLHMIPMKKFEKIQENSMEWHKNYIVFKGRPKKYFLHIADYKTYQIYGIKRAEIKDRTLIRCLDIQRKMNGSDGPLFKLSSGQDMNNNTLSQLMIKYSNKHLGKNISSTMIYKILIHDLTEKYKNALDDEDSERIKFFKEKLEEFSNSRGHSFVTQQSIYGKKYLKFD